MNKSARILVLVFLALFSPQGWGTKESNCDDAGKIFKFCQDQGKVYENVLAQAKEKEKLLVVVFGAEWCPWCQSMHKILSAPDFALAPKFVLAEIGVYQGKEKLESGRAVMKKVQEQSGSKEKIAGVPVLAVVNPRNGKAEMIPTEPLEKNTKTAKGHDAKKVQAALEAASAKVQ